MHDGMQYDLIFLN